MTDNDYLALKERVLNYSKNQSLKKEYTVRKCKIVKASSSKCEVTATYDSNDTLISIKCVDMSKTWFEAIIISLGISAVCFMFIYIISSAMIILAKEVWIK